MEVTTEAGVGEVAESIAAPVLLGDDVFDLKGCEDVSLGRRQYSHSPTARWRTSSLMASSILGTFQ